MCFVPTCPAVPAYGRNGSGKFCGRGGAVVGAGSKLGPLIGSLSLTRWFVSGCVGDGGPLDETSPTPLISLDGRAKRQEVY